MFLASSFSQAARGDGGEGGSAGAASPGEFWAAVNETYRTRLSVVGSEPDPGSDAYLPGPDRGEQDSDLRLLVDGGYVSAGGRFKLNGAFALWYDVDGVADDDVTAFASLYDVPQPWLDVMSLVAEYRGAEDAAVVRAGRLTAEIGLPTTFDGASLAISPGRVRVFAFGGRSVHFFETDAGIFEDWMGSLGVTADLLPTLKLSADYRFTSEVVDTSLASRDSVIDHAYGVSLRARPRPWAMGRVWVRGLNTALSHAGFTGRLVSSGADLGMDGSIETQLVTLDEVNEQLDPYYAILGPSQPNARWAVDAWRQVELPAGVARVHAGWNGRKVLEGEEGPFNRSMGRLYAMAGGAGLFETGFGGGVSLEWHYAGVSDAGTRRRLLTGGGWLDYDAGHWTVRAGTQYQSFKYDYFEDVREIESVRTWYADSSWAPKSWIRVGARYTFERSDRDFHTVRVNLTQRF